MVNVHTDVHLLLCVKQWSCFDEVIMITLHVCSSGL